ncbi:MAG TPA: alpha-ketoglutarate-dependent dioxygenase AlkB [Fimbriimonadaceae bacterium]|nr:alpha-ketoglutarate-dependent dioxygenase AlkB [Fimbriimonadaceae bacterium]
MGQVGLFEVEQDEGFREVVAAINTAAVAKVEGLRYIRGLVTPEEESVLLGFVDAGTWSTELSRRVQHFGYKYDYRARSIDGSIGVGPLPKWLQDISERLAREGVFETPPDQVIANEYLPGQGIAQHVDCEPCFGETIAPLSLGSGIVMDFDRPPTGEKGLVWLEPRSLVVLSGPARYEWRHGIAKRKKDAVANAIVPRARRVSLTFRRVV